MSEDDYQFGVYGEDLEDQAANARLSLMVSVDGSQHIVKTPDDAEDVQVLLLIKSERAGGRGDTFGRDYYAYTANTVGYQFNALKQGRLLPPTEI